MALILVLAYIPDKAQAQCNCSGGQPPLTVVYDTSGLIPPANDSTVYNFRQFDPTLGTLVCVGLEAWVTGIVRMRLENDEIYPINYTIKYTRSDKVSGTGLGTPLQNNLTKNYGPYPLAESDYIYFSGPDYKAIGPDTVLFNKLISTTISSNVTPFLGAGVVTYSYRVSGSTVVTGSSNYIFSINSIDRLRFRLTYSYCPNNLLAAGIKDFAATKKGSQAVVLGWTTQEEESTNNYEIESSKDGRVFQSIGSVKANSEATADAKYEYQHNLTQSVGGKYFYRIKQISANGEAKYSAVRTVVFDNGKTEKFALYPNPARGRVNLEWSGALAGDMRVEILNNAGQQVYVKTFEMAGSSMINLDIPTTITPGLYFIRTKDLTTNVQRLTKLVIQ